jgi:UDP-glucose 4-epimerase
VLEFCRKKNSKIVYAGSSSQFAEEGKILSPYTWTKATNVELTKNYGLWYGLPYAITYFYNVYGPREQAGPYGTVIGIFRSQHERGEPLTVRSPGTQRRNFTHILDIVDGLIVVGERGEGDGFHIGADRSYSILEVAALFGGAITMLPPNPGNRTESMVLSEKTRVLGWRPVRNLKNYIESYAVSGGVL